MKIESAEENEFLTWTFITASKGNYWIGLSDQMEEGKWMWTDGSLLTKYNNWGKNNPNNYRGYQNCGMMIKGYKSYNGFNDGEWNDNKCSNSYGYICEKFFA